MTSFGPGSEIGPYRVLRRLGRGSYGDVYQVEGNAAVKVMRRDRRTEQTVSRFLAEVSVMEKVGPHPCIMRLLAPARELPHQGGLYFAMELVSGGGLDELVARGGYDLRTVLKLARCLSSGLDQIHQAGVLHRDLALSNILLDSDGVPRITDFGMARYLESSASEKTPDFWFAHGDPEFAAPERLFHIESGEMGDVYSLGVVLYALYTRQGLFPLSELSFLYNLYNRPMESYFRTCLNHGLPCPKVDFKAVYEHYLKRAPAVEPVPAMEVSAGVREGMQELLRDLLEPDAWRRLRRFGSLSGVHDRLMELGEMV